MALDELQEFFRTFDKDIYRVMAGGRGAPSEAQMVDFEKALDFQLPADFREFTLSPLGGLYIEVREELWPRPKAAAKPSWKDHFGLKIFGLSVPIPEWLDLREEIMRLPEEEGDLIPFMGRTGTQDRYCFDLDGGVLHWSAGDGSRRPLAQSFAEVALAELAELEKRRARLKPSKQR